MSDCVPKTVYTYLILILCPLKIQPANLNASFLAKFLGGWSSLLHYKPLKKTLISVLHWMSMWWSWEILRRRKRHGDRAFTVKKEAAGLLKLWYLRKCMTSHRRVKQSEKCQWVVLPFVIQKRLIKRNRGRRRRGAAVMTLTHTLTTFNTERK
jgi:hypothetical protein